MNIKKIKRNAKKGFYRYYWLTVAVSYIFTLICGTGTLSFSGTSYKQSENYFTNNLSEEAKIAIFSILLITIIISMIAIVITTLLIGPMSVGYCTYTTKIARGQKPSFVDLFCGFKRFGRNCAAGVLVTVYTTLWSMLFIIPGIIKSYSYSQTFYLLADDPKLGPNEAITKSRELMDGYKGSLFVLELSFFGWIMLNIITFGILGVFFLNPYMNVAKSNFYTELVPEEKPQNPIEAEVSY